MSSQVFVEATKVSSALEGYAYDGVVGLGFWSGSEMGAPLLPSMIAGGVLNEPVVSFFLDR